MSVSPIHQAILQLIDVQRLTGVTSALALDGVPFLSPADDAVDPVDSITFDADGISVQRSAWGGAMIRDVEDVRAALLASGGAKETAAAHALPQYFVRIADIQEGADPKLEYTARENSNYVYMTRAFAGYADPRAVALMTEYSPRYYVKGTKTPEYRYLAANKVDHVPGGANPSASIPNHRICVGEWTAQQLGTWAKAWVVRHVGGTFDPGSEVLGL